MLIGAYDCSIDLKGRLNFPAKLREDLGEEFLVAKGLGDNCLCVYSKAEWAILEEKIKTLPLSKARNFQRFFFASAGKAEPDKQGRIVIPQALREYAGLEKDVKIIGSSTHCEIWSLDRWNAFCDTMDSATISAVMDELGI